MSYTRRQFSTDLLKALGNKNPDGYIVSFVVAWSIWETAAGQSAAYNLLNTTQPMPGATNYNSVGVKNYINYTQGVEATIKTLNNGLYTALVTALRSNQVGKLISRDRGIEQALNTWSGNAGYYQKILAVAQNVHNGTDKRGDDTFGGQASIVSTPTTTTGKREPRIADLKPDASVSEILGDIDVLMVVNNPFNVNVSKQDFLGSMIVDPMEWMTEFGLNLGENAIAFHLRMILVVLGTIILWKGIKHGLGIDPFAQLLGGGDG